MHALAFSRTRRRVPGPECARERSRRSRNPARAIFAQYGVPLFSGGHPCDSFISRLCSPRPA